MSTTEQLDPAATTGSTPKARLLAGLGVGLACLLDCSFPVILSAGALAGVGTLLTGAKTIGLVALAAVAAGVVWLLRRRRDNATDGDCGCGGSC